MLKELIVATALALALAGSCGGIALAQQSTTIQLAQAGKISAEDQEFLTKALEAGAAEVQISQLALEKSLNEQVRGFAERMVQNHTTANQKLLSLAQGVSNTSQTKIDQKHQAMLQQLSQLSGEDFDRQCKNGCGTTKGP
jgi:putative membrane protein